MYPDPNQQQYPQAPQPGYGQPGYGQPGYGQPGYPPGYAPPPGYPMGVPPQGTNGLAIASFVLSLLGFCFLGIPFGIIALNQIKQRNQGGRGLAIAGLAISGISVLLAVAIFGLAALGASKDSASHDNSTRPPSVSGPTTVSLDEVRVGDCVQKFAADVSIRTLTVVPCNTAHQMEVIAQVHLDGSWPGSKDTVFQRGSASCNDQVDKVLGSSPGYDKLTTILLYPDTQTRWDQTNGRITCGVRNTDGTNLTARVPR
ncbi:DUF4190 domain-containing protein [Nocardia heshunensis]